MHNAPSPSRTEPDEPQKAGIEFVDILFALVVGEALDALVRTGRMPAAGRSHLAFAGLLTIMSWIGYHNSDHRYSGQITFSSRTPLKFTALGKFLVDIALVVLYWLAVRTTDGGFGTPTSPSWAASVSIAALAFVLYVAWDVLAWAAPRESGHDRSRFLSWRRVVSIWFAVLAVGIAFSALAAEPAGNGAVTVVNILLCVLVVFYRVAKDMRYTNRVGRIMWPERLRKSAAEADQGT